MYAEPLLVEVISGKLRPPPPRGRKIVLFIRNLVAFILSLSDDKCASHSII